MGKLSVFNFITLNGFYKGENNDTSWHQHGSGEEGEFAAEGAKSDSILLFGRVTYEMMASFWPTPAALQSMPEVANGMNASEKIVFSKTLKSTNWQNSRIISGNIIEETKKLKENTKKDLTILGSGSITSQFADAGLIDLYMFMLDPLALGKGTPIFNGVKQQVNLKLENTRTFKSGRILLTYQKA